MVNLSHPFAPPPPPKGLSLGVGFFVVMAGGILQFIRPERWHFRFTRSKMRPKVQSHVFFSFLLASWGKDLLPGFGG